MLFFSRLLFFGWFFFVNRFFLFRDNRFINDNRFRLDGFLSRFFGFWFFVGRCRFFFLWFDFGLGFNYCFSLLLGNRLFNLINGFLVLDRFFYMLFLNLNLVFLPNILFFNRNILSFNLLFRSFNNHFLCFFFSLNRFRFLLLNNWFSLNIFNGLFWLFGFN